MSDAGLFGAEAGQTPLGPDEARGLLDTSVSTRADLNEVEEANIARGRASWWRRRRSIDDVLDVSALRRLHAVMFGDVWSWAGTFRRRDISVSSIDWQQVPVLLENLVADTRRQMDVASDHDDIDAVGCRFHHRLVLIHPFPNGNGRHGREATDLLLRAAGGVPFTWGRLAVASGRTSRDANRSQYLRALRAADGHDYSPLASFVRT